MENPVLQNIINRRSIIRFDSYQIKKEELDTILEAGRWAPSFANIQPWKFVVVQDDSTKKQLGDIAGKITVSDKGVVEASAIIAVCVNPTEDSHHSIEAGAVAAHNICLAAQSIGLASYWLGVFQLKETRKSAEKEVKDILAVPKEYRVIALLPIGKPKNETIEKTRKETSEIVYYDRFGGE